MSEYKNYFTNRSLIQMRPYEPGEEVRWVDKVHVSPKDGATGSPKIGDFIARSPEDPDKEFLVTAVNAKSYIPAPESHTGASGVAQSYDELREERDTGRGRNPNVRDPVMSAEARAEAATKAKAEGDTETAEKAEAPKSEPGQIDGQQMTAETAKPDGEKRVEVAQESPEESSEEEKDESPKEEEKPADKAPEPIEEPKNEEAPKSETKKEDPKSSGRKPLSFGSKK